MPTSEAHTQLIFYHITHYEIEFVTNNDQTKTQCNKLSVVLHGQQRSTNLIHLDENFPILPSTMQSHRYIIECSSIGTVQNIQLYLVNLEGDWYLDEIIIHRHIMLESSDDTIFEQTFLYDSKYIRANPEQSVINILTDSSSIHSQISDSLTIPERLNGSLTSEDLTDTALGMPASSNSSILIVRNQSFASRSNISRQDSIRSFTSSYNTTSRPSERIGYKIKVRTGSGKKSQSNQISQLACRVHGSNSKTRKIDLPLSYGYGNRCFTENATDEFYITGRDVGVITGCELFLKGQPDTLDWTISQFEAKKSEEALGFIAHNEHVRYSDIRNKPFLIGTTLRRSDDTLRHSNHTLPHSNHSASDFSDFRQSRENIIRIDDNQSEVFGGAPPSELESELDDMQTPARSPFQLQKSPILDYSQLPNHIDTSILRAADLNPDVPDDFIPNPSFNWKNLNVNTMKKQLKSENTSHNNDDNYKIYIGTSPKDLNATAIFNVQIFGNHSRQSFYFS